MDLARIARVIRGRPDRPLEDRTVSGISTDTRTLRPGDLFFALRGARFDAHDFVADAFRRGAAAAVVERDPGGAPGPLVYVADAWRALGDLAAAWRMALPARVIGVAGSNGKTTTKDMIAHILGRDRRVVQAQGSFNNLAGVPLTIFQADARTEAAVLEIGTNRPGEVARLGAIARPDVAVIVSVGAEHLEGLGSIDGVADEETSLLGFLRAGGFAVVHDDPRIRARVRLSAAKTTTFGFGEEADFRPERVEREPGGMRFRLRGVEFRLGLLGEWNVQNALAAAAVAVHEGVPLEECARRLADFRGPKMRMERLELGGVTILNDAYNSNPESASRAVREFARLETGGRRVAVMGDMKELGAASAEYHRALGRLLAESGVDVVVGVGPECRALLEAVGEAAQTRGFARVEELRAVLGEIVRPGDAVLLKGSRSVGLEQVVKWIGEGAAAPVGSGR
jgi:UDP-N-acetylmuramoyl-tripeptide--D-alanyl-D-alanine ligase